MLNLWALKSCVACTCLPPRDIGTHTAGDIFTVLNDSNSQTKDNEVQQSL